MVSALIPELHCCERFREDLNGDLAIVPLVVHEHSRHSAVSPFAHNSITTRQCLVER